MLYFLPRLAGAQSNFTFRVMTYNIHHAEGLDGVIDTQRIADLINQEQADLVGLQEVDVGTTRVSGRNLIAELAQKTGMNYVFSNNLSFQGGQYGNGILSRFPIKFRDHRLLPQVGNSEQRGWLKAIVDIHGNDLSFWVTHLDSRATNVERMVCATNFNNWLAQETAPVVFVGDFNDTPNSPVYALMTSKWQDSYTQVGQGNGYTIPSDSPSHRIDYIWTANGKSPRAVNAWVPDSQASDHRPVVTEMQITLTNNLAHPAIYFPLNEGSGTNVSDAAQQLIGNFLPSFPVWTNDTPTGQPGDFALAFNGAARVSIPDTNHLIGPNFINGDYTLETWVKLPPGFSPTARMVMFQYEGFPGFSFSINTGRTLHTTAFTIKDINSTAIVPNDNAWHHAAVVHEDGVEMRFYLDAVLASTIAYTNGPGNRSNYSLTIGGASSGANLFTGTLDRVRYSPYALSPTQFDFPAVPPALQVRTSGSNVLLTWPAIHAGYVLESATGFPSADWTPLTYSVQNGENQAIQVPSNTARFYRLRK
jgi:endonuclease/exonuclease/phosphatase family metal-dependent hydrolase